MNPPKRRPIQPKPSFLGAFHPTGLHFGNYYAPARGPYATQRGELRHPRLRHAGETPPEGFAWRKTPTTAGAATAQGPDQDLYG